ncbi:uncharacterized protein LOC114515808 isoform X2 [Dendronephthya gigantea]|uniref:uncharacterized protein LOC114515808 isoform X2 n=1 Tax=Dendronephthya gigantea TaxID=151771 RepID=UPI00106D0C17|nr:uncharacterized protein LOC114515808 isoform X2 [Dendronephthya gigantea]
MSRNDERESRDLYEQRTTMFPIRQELVGKRFIVISEEASRRSAKNPHFENYNWKQGYVRACSVQDIQDKELQVLVEFDGASWEYRQWIKIYEQTKAFFVEKTLVWATRVYHRNSSHRNAIPWPALLFFPLVDYLGLEEDPKHPVEYFGDKQLVFLKENEIQWYQDCDENLKKVNCLNALVQGDLDGWQRLQKTQACLMKGARTLTGARVTVYRLELRQWYTGCITAHNLTTRELHVMDDNVLQTHPVHPALVQINLIANNDELHQILLGEQIKMLPTRSQRTPQIYFQSNCPQQKAPHGGNWHMMHELNNSQTKAVWSRPSVVHSVSQGKAAFGSPSGGNHEFNGNQKTSAQSVCKQNASLSAEKNTEILPGSHSLSKVKVHKPIPVVLKPSDNLPYSHYTPQHPQPSSSPLLSSLSTPPSPLQTQHTPSPLSGQLTPSPQSMRNQTPPLNESPFSISLCDQPSARAAAEKGLGRAGIRENKRTNRNSQNSLMTSSRKTSVIETPEKNKANSRLVCSPPSSPSSNNNTANGNSQGFPPGVEPTPVATPPSTCETQNGGHPARTSSSDSDTTSRTAAVNTPGVHAYRKKKSGKNSAMGKATPPTRVVPADAQKQPAKNQKHPLEKFRSSRKENGSMQLEPVEKQGDSRGSGGTQADSTEPRRTQVDSCGSSVIQDESTGSKGTQVDGTGSRGTKIENTGSRGTQVESIGSRGTQVENTGSRGTHVDLMGSKGTQVDLTGSRGTQVDLTGSRGTQVDLTGPRGTQVDLTGSRGTQSESMGSKGTPVEFTGSRGTLADSTVPRETQTDSTGSRGMQSGSMGPRGSHVESSGSRETQPDSTGPRGTLTDGTGSREAQAECSGSRGTHVNTPSCSHLRTIAEIQLEYLIFLEALVRFQHRMIMEAINTINQPITEEQFFFVADFFCKLVEGNRHTENIFREANFTRQERQRVEHQRHQPQAASPKRVVTCLSDEIKARLRSAQEAVSREREQVLSVVLPNFDEIQKKEQQQREWEAFKQQLQKQQKAFHREGIQKQNSFEERMPYQAQSDPQNNLQGYQDKTRNQGITGSLGDNFAPPFPFDPPNQVPAEMIERQRMHAQQPDEAPQAVEATTTQAGSIHSPIQEGCTLLPQQQTRSDLLGAPQHLQQLRSSLLLQREQLYEQQKYEKVQKRMLDELFQMKDVEQKTVLLQHIVQELQSQKASSRDVLKSPPTISTGFGCRTTESQLTKVQSRRIQSSAPRQANETPAPQPVSTATDASYISAEQLLSSLTTSPLKKPNVWSIADTIGVGSSGRSETQSTPASDKVSRNPDQSSSSGLHTGNADSNLSGSTSPRHDATLGVDIAGEVGTMMDKTTKANDSRAKKRRTPSLVVSDDSEETRKPKRHRKNSKKKHVSENTGHSHHPDWIPRSKQIMPVRSVPPGEEVTLTMTSDDRDVNPVKANCTQYYPRSISKGIGFVPIEPSTEASTSLLMTTTASQPLDVLASISASLRTNDLPQSTLDVTRTTARSVIQSVPGKNRLSANENRQHSELSPTHVRREQHATEEDRQRTDGIGKTTNAVRQGVENIQISNARGQAQEFGVSADPSATVSEKQTSSVGKKSAGESGQSAASEGSHMAVTGSNLVDLLIQDKRQSIQNPMEQVMTILDSSGKDKTHDVVNKQKKRKRDRQKKDKKSGNKDVEAATAENKDSLPNTALNMSLLFFIANEKKNNSNNVFPVTEQLVQSISERGDKTKQNSFPINDLSNQDSSKPIDPTCAVISQDVQPFNVVDNLLASTELLISKEKQKKKEIDGVSKAKRKEKKSKHDGSKTKKSAEKKSVENKTKDSQTDRKGDALKTDKSSTKFAKPSKTDDKQVSEEWNLDRLGSGSNYSVEGELSAGVNADEISPSMSAEDTVVIEISQPENNIEILPSEGELGEGKVDVVSLDASVKPTEAVPLQLLDTEVEDISQKLKESKLEHNKNVNDKVETVVQNVAPEIPGKFAFIGSPKKQKNDSTKSHGKKSSTEKNRKKSTKEAKSKKNTKKTDRKSDKNNLKSLDKEKEQTRVSSQEVVVQVNGILTPPGTEQERPGVELGIADAILKENGLEKEQGDILFINDQSVKNIVNADDENDDVFSERLLDRKRKRCKSPQENNSVLLENNDIVCSVLGVNKETTSATNSLVSSKKTGSKKSSENGEKKETKVRKKKAKKDEEPKNDSAIAMETDTSAVDNSVKQEEKKESGEEAKKKVKKPKEKKVREKIPKEEWVYSLQRGSCKSLPTMPQCRECRNYETEEEAVLNKSCCRFDMFRRCRSKSNKFEMAGFSSSEHTHSDDFLPWVAGKDISQFLSLDVSKYILLNVGDEFCNLVQQEEKAFSWETKKDTVAWKRAVRGIREMCDACATTIFNVHWVCPKCGFGVCLDCYKTKLNISIAPEAGRAKRFLWVRCSANTSHRPQRLVLTHIIPKETLHEIDEQLHQAREYWGIGENCPCKGQRKKLKDSATIKELREDEKENIVDNSGENCPVPEKVSDNVELADKTEQKSEQPMEVDAMKIDGKKDEESLTAEDKNGEIVKPEVLGSNESVAIQFESITGELPEDETKKQLEVDKISEQECCANESPVDDKVLQSNTQKISGQSEEPPSSNVSSKPPDVCENTEACEEDSCDVRVDRDNIGALGFLMDYESPVSSPAASPQPNMDFEEISITPAEEALLSRPSTTQGESSVMTSTSLETAVEPSVATDTTSKLADENSPIIGECSEVVVESLAMTFESLTSETSELTGYLPAVDDINVRVAPRISDEIPAPHSWICRRPMLRLHDPHHEGNLLAFQSRWEKGEPVLVSGVDKRMTSHLWTPEGFENEFGSEKADVVNCKTGGTLEKMEIGTFWRGFESVKDRPLDNKGEPTLLKLKDWPPEADFVEKMPTRFKDLMDALPLPEYTSRDGSRNLVSRLPDFFVKPDLGPKMYNAYGNAAFPSAGTTNLHVDMSDAVNVMVYVGVPFDDREYGEQERRDSVACVDVACDEVQQHRARNGKEKLGALWHIFAAEDANKIRALFHKVCCEKNMKYPASHDPIHDQCFYLDEPLLKRLKDEYGVVGWPIAQFLGDAVFIPAGAPHQVRNLHSCVKAAEDFVSPEHVGHCFKLTEEFRHLSDKHTNHEDKLQVKNIIYHAVKDAVSVLRHHEFPRQQEESV